MRDNRRAYKAAEKVAAALIQIDQRPGPNHPYEVHVAYLIQTTEEPF